MITYSVQISYFSSIWEYIQSIYSSQCHGHYTLHIADTGLVALQLTRTLNFLAEVVICTCEVLPKVWNIGAYQLPQSIVFYYAGN